MTYFWSSIRFSNFAKIFAIVCVAMPLAGCNMEQMSRDTNDAKYRAQLASQTYRLELNAVIHKQQLKIANIESESKRRLQKLQAETLRKLQILKAETARLKDQANAAVMQTVGQAVVFGLVAAAIAFFLRQAFAFFIGQAALNNRFRIAEYERTQRCLELVNLLKDPECGLSPEQRQDSIDRVVEVTNTPLLT